MFSTEALNVLVPSSLLQDCAEKQGLKERCQWPGDSQNSFHWLKNMVFKCPSMTRKLHEKSYDLLTASEKKHSSSIPSQQGEYLSLMLRFIMLFVQINYAIYENI